jgi:enoyl-CoA hydratase/carnithine racemase
MQKRPRDVIDSMAAPNDGALVQLHIRVIAIENLMIALLVNATDAQRALACGLAAHIAPRPGSTQHPLTIYAARRMRDMVERAEHLAASEPVRHMALRQQSND